MQTERGATTSLEPTRGIIDVVTDPVNTRAARDESGSAVFRALRNGDGEQSDLSARNTRGDRLFFMITE
jgi:hypothetical protein